jgi:hypothetical protein
VHALPLLVVLLLAFAARVYRLDFQSLWGDEGLSLLRATLPVGEMIRTLPREHVPGYWLLLHPWLSLAGTTDFALRYFSLIPSVLAIAVAYRLAADLGSRRAGLLAALLLATNAFQVWYAQEARMYGWLVAVGTGSTWLLWRLLNARRWGLIFVGYVVLVSAAINLHFFGFLIPLAHAAFAVVWLISRRNVRAFARWVAGGLLVLVLYLPWWPRLLGPSALKGWVPAPDPALVPWRFFTAYLVGDAMPPALHEWLPWTYLVLILFGVVAWFQRNRLGGWLLATAAFVSLAAASAIAISTRAYHERYSSFLSMPLAMLAAGGFAAFAPRHWRTWLRDGPGKLRSPVSTWLAALVLAVLVGGNCAALYRMYTDSMVQKADCRAIVARIQRGEAPGDVILAHGLAPVEVLMHYYEGNLPMYPVQPLLRRGDAEVGAALAEITEGAQHVWMVHSFPPTTSIEYWLAAHAWLADRIQYGNENLTLSVYGLPTLPQRDLPQGIAFGPELRLARAVVAGGSGNGLSFRAGDLIGITTAWDVLRSPPSLNFSLRLLDADGRTWLTSDRVPLEGAAPTQTWQPGQEVEDRMGFILPPDLPPGAYDVFLMLYDPATGVPVSVGERDGATLASIEVAPAAVAPDPASLPIPGRVDKNLGDQLELLGYSITPQPLRPGQGATLSLWWRAAGRPVEPYRLRVQASGPDGQLAFDGEYELSSAPADTWEPGQVVREMYDLALDPSAGSGVYRVGLSLLTADGQPYSAGLNLGAVAVSARARTYRLPRVSHPLEASLGDSVLLRGYDLTVPQASGGDLEVTLYWQARGRVPGSYKVFVHLVDEAGRTVAQADAVPADGLAPTESWQPGEIISDKHLLGAPGPGRYRLLVGLYDPGTGERLPALDATGRPIPENAVPLGDVEAP